MTRQMRDEIGGRIGSRHGGFAARLAGRYAFSRAPASASAMRLRAAQRGSLILSLRPTLSFTPRFELSFAVAADLREAARPAMAIRPAIRISAPAAVTRERAAPQRALEPSRRALVLRAEPARPAPIERGMRLRTVRETVSQVRLVRALEPKHSPAAPPDAPAVRRDPPVVGPRREFAVAALPRAMARPAEQPLAAAIGRLEAAVGRLAGEARQDAFRPTAEILSPMPSADPRRIADEVLRTLDHRVVAMRERMGRR